MRAKTESPVIDADSHLAEARDQILFHLPSHPRLLRAREARRVRVGIGRDGPVEHRRLVDADALADLAVVAPEAIEQGRVLLGLSRRVEDLLNGDQELRDHVPVDAPEPLVLVERARAAGEGPVSYTHLRAHETRHDLVCRLLLEKKKKTKKQNNKFKNAIKK